MSPKRRYPTDLTDRQWELVGLLLPDRLPAGPGGRPRSHERREVVNAILYHVRAGGAWRMLPKDLPPWETVYGYFARWRRDGTLDLLHDALREQVRSRQEQRNPEPSAGIVDSQSLKGADTVSTASRGYDAGKKNQRSQAPHRLRHDRAAARRDGHRGLGPGSRRRPGDPQASTPSA
jgi:transposase